MKILKSAFALTLLLAALAVPLWAVDGPLTALMNLRGRVDSSGYLLVDCPACAGGGSSGGTLTNNNAAPSTANMGVLGCVANAAAPTLTETYQNLVSCDLHGATRTLLMDSSGAVVSFLTAAQGGAAPTGAAVPANAVYQGAQDASTFLIGDIDCTSSIIYDASTSGNTQLVAISGSKNIFICGYEMLAAGTVNLSLVAGTGSACASAASGTPSTGTSGASAALTPAWQFTTQTGKLSAYPTHGYLITTGTANALCLKESGAVAAQVQVFYSQR